MPTIGEFYGAGGSQSVHAVPTRQPPSRPPLPQLPPGRYEALPAATHQTSHGNGNRSQRQRPGGVERDLRGAIAEEINSRDACLRRELYWECNVLDGLCGSGASGEAARSGGRDDTQLRHQALGGSLRQNDELDRGVRA